RGHEEGDTVGIADRLVSSDRPVQFHVPTIVLVGPTLGRMVEASKAAAAPALPSKKPGHWASGMWMTRRTLRVNSRLTYAGKPRGSGNGKSCPPGPAKPPDRRRPAVGGPSQLRPALP